MKAEHISNTKVGYSFLIYGPPGSGKTYALGSLSILGKTLIINSEERNLGAVLSDFRSNKNLYVTKPIVSYDKLMEGLYELSERYEKGETPYDFVCLDGSTFLHRSFKGAIEDVVAERRDDKGKEITLLDRWDIGERGWGAVGASMHRVTKALFHLTHYGVFSFMTAGVLKSPKYDKTLEYVPAFLGKDYTILSPYYPDHIGFLSFRQGEEGELVYPSNVSFCSPDESFEAKTCTTKLRRTALFELPKIVKLLKHEATHRE